MALNSRHNSFGSIPSFSLRATRKGVDDCTLGGPWLDASFLYFSLRFIHSFFEITVSAFTQFASRCPWSWRAFSAAPTVTSQTLLFLTRVKLNEAKPAVLMCILVARQTDMRDCAARSEYLGHSLVVPLR